MTPTSIQKRRTAFEKLGTRANYFSRSVSVFFAVVGFGALFLSYSAKNWLGNNSATINQEIALVTDVIDTTNNVDTNSNNNKNAFDENRTAFAKNAFSNGNTNPATLTAQQIKKTDLAAFTLRDNFGKALIRGGVSATDAYLATTEARRIYPLSSLGEGQVIKIDFGQASNGQKFLKQASVRIGDATELLVSRTDAGQFIANINNLRVDNSRKLYRFKVAGSLVASAETVGISRETIQSMVDLLSFDIDLERDIAQGDLIQMLVDETTNNNTNAEVGGNLRVVLISSQAGKDRSFYYYLAEDGTVGYYDEDGKSQRKMLIRTPIDGARLVSNYGVRLHPILGYTRAHRGIDFAAPTGTPIYAAGDGVVEYVGWKTGYGNYISIRHKNGYSTAYAHMSRFQKDIRIGSIVRQRQTIGYVGNTGLSTGPHLHYEILVAQNQVNPLTVKLDALRALGGNDLIRFQNFKRESLAKIQNAEIMVSR